MRTAVERPRRWAPRAAAVLLVLLAVAAVLVLAPARADAHPLSTTAVLLDIGPEEVTGQVQLPVDRLAIALDQPLTAALGVNTRTLAVPWGRSPASRSWAITAP